MKKTRQKKTVKRKKTLNQSKNSRSPKGLVQPSRFTGEQLRKFSESVGEFIRYWGFRNIHGAIWSQIFLSKVPLSGSDLVHRLQVSKALVSPAIKELEEYGLIHQTEGSDERRKAYMPELDVIKVIRQILDQRERRILQRVQVEASRLAALANTDPTFRATVDERQLHVVEGMVRTANLALEALLYVEDFDMMRELSNLLQEMKGLQ
jgi:DNA-binding transcriptional regulator GbsR (MarR family)